MDIQMNHQSTAMIPRFQCLGFAFLISSNVQYVTKFPLGNIRTSLDLVTSLKGKQGKYSESNFSQNFKET